MQKKRYPGLRHRLRFIGRWGNNHQQALSQENGIPQSDHWDQSVQRSRRLDQRHLRLLSSLLEHMFAIK